jgi:hypothetical protein
MKNVIQTFILAVFCLLLAPTQSFGQLYEVSLDEKIEKSTLIVEGKVVETQTYKADDGTIYTSNKIELLGILKGEYHSKDLYITTWGGEYEGELQTWTHLLTLSKGDYGLFFLEPTQVPISKTANEDEVFDVYSASQGYVAFVKNASKAWIGVEPFHVYEDISKDLYGHIEKSVGQKMTVVNKGGDTKRSGIRYHFTDIGFDGTTITFVINVNSLVGDKKLYQSGIQFGYNPAFFGANIATNGNLQLQNVGISALNTYNLTKSNVTSSKVKIELLPSGSIGNIAGITVNEQLLAKGSISIQNFLADPGIVYNLAEMQSMSKYYDVGGQAVVFDTVVVDGDFRAFESCNPVITSVTPKTVSGGTGDVITIRGTCFKSYVNGFSDVWFTDAAKGPNPINWMYPLKSEFDNGCISGSIICWTDTLIKVRVPSVSNFAPDSSDIGKYAGTGRIQVFNSESFTSGISPEPITVRFSAKNKFTKFSENPPSISLKHTLREANNNGGITLTLGATLSADINAKARFLSALNTWKCATKVNFDTDATFPNTSSNVCLIDIGTVPNGVLGSTQESTFRCKTIGSNGNFVRSAQAKFKMLFSDSIPQYKGLDSLGIGLNEFDFESTALHEIGHAHGLNHTNQINDVMFWSGTTGLNGIKRNLRPNDHEGGLYIMGISKISYPGTNCNFFPMIDDDLTTSNCLTPINEIPIRNSFSIFPNPIQDQVIVKPSSIWEINQSKISTIYIRNIMGDLLISKSINIIPSKEYLIDTSSLKSGIYIITIEDGNMNFQSYKLIKL